MSRFQRYTAAGTALLIVLISGGDASGSASTGAPEEGAPVTGTPTSSPGLPDGPENIAPLVEALTSSEPGVGESARSGLADVVARAERCGDAIKRRRVAEALKGYLGENHTPALRREVLKLLAVVADETDASAMAPLLQDTALANDVCSALKGIPGAEVDRILIDAIRSAKPALRVTLMASLAERGTPAAIPVLQQEAQAPDVIVRWAAFDALTRLGCPPNTIFPPSSSFSHDQMTVYAFGYIHAAEACAGRGDYKRAEELLVYVLGRTPQADLVRAALQGLGRIQAPSLIAQALGYLTEPRFHDTARQLLVDASRPETNERLAQAYAHTGGAMRSALLDIAAVRKMPQLQTLLAEAVADPSPEVRLTAVDLAGGVPDLVLVKDALAGGSPWGRERAAGHALQTATALLATGETAEARVLFENVALAEPVSMGRRVAALEGIQAIAGPKSLACIDRLVRSAARAKGQDRFLTALEAAAVAVYAAQEDPALARSRLQALVEKPLLPGTAELARARLAACETAQGASEKEKP